MNKPTLDKIAKLPAWARDHIHNLQTCMEGAQAKLDSFLNENQEGSIKVRDCIRTMDGLEVADYKINASRIQVNHAGVLLDISIAQDDEISLQWCGGDSMHHLRDVALIPVSYQMARLLSKDNMR